MDKLKLAVIADNPSLHTGYGTIARAIGNYGSKFFDISYVGLQHIGSPVEIKNKKGERFPMYAGSIAKPSESNMVENALKQIEPDITLTVREPITFSPAAFPQAFYIPKGKYKRVSWIPAMSEYVPTFIVMDLMKNTDNVLTFTNAAKYVYKNAGVPYNLIETQHLGYDSKVFNPDGTTDYFKGKEVFTFVGNANSTRERIGLLIMAFGKYLKEYNPDAYLYLHMFDDNNNYTTNLKLYAEMFGVTGHILKPKNIGKLNGVPDTELADIYRSSVATVSTSPQDGFNLPFLEAIGCGSNAVGNDIPFYDWSKHIIKVHAPVEEELGISFGKLSSASDFARGMHMAKESKLSSKAVNDIKKNFDWGHIMGELNAKLLKL